MENHRDFHPQHPVGSHLGKHLIATTWWVSGDTTAKNRLLVTWGAHHISPTHGDKLDDSRKLHHTHINHSL